MQTFLIISTCFLYLVAAGLFSRAVWFFETQEWNNIVGGDAAELGEGPGSYDIDRSVWHVNVSDVPFPTETKRYDSGARLIRHQRAQCCSPNLNGGGGWSIFNAIFGWNNSATYGSVISYNVYWLAIMAGFSIMSFHETHGYYPLLKGRSMASGPKGQQQLDEEEERQASSKAATGREGDEQQQDKIGQGVPFTTTVTSTKES
jgi:high-affinity iron transporter